MKDASWALLEKAQYADFNEFQMVVGPSGMTPQEWLFVASAVSELEQEGFVHAKWMKRSKRFAVEITPLGKRALRRWRSFQADECAKAIQEMWTAGSAADQDD